MTTTPDSLRADLSDLTNQAAQADKATNDLTRGAEERRAWIDARLDELRPTALTDEDAGEEYQQLVAERGQLDTSFPA